VNFRLEPKHQKYTIEHRLEAPNEKLLVVKLTFRYANDSPPCAVSIGEGTGLARCILVNLTPPEVMDPSI
jgi:hypothetical protein